MHLEPAISTDGCGVIALRSRFRETKRVESKAPVQILRRNGGVITGDCDEHALYRRRTSSSARSCCDGSTSR